MWRRCRSRLAVCAVIGLAVVASCGPPRFPRELFTISAEGSEVPVMLSQMGRWLSLRLPATRQRMLLHWYSSRTERMLDSSR